MIVGIDEVGRGAWAGPLVVGAILLDDAIVGLTDSKVLSKNRREHFAKIIKERAKFIGLGWVWPKEIDGLGLTAATKLAIERALTGLETNFTSIIIDGNYNYLSDTYKNRPCAAVVNADMHVPSVSAASIVAKVARDKYMAEQSLIHKDYGFAAHVGYGTKLHQSMLNQLGVCEIHRKSFKPVSTCL